MKNYKVAIISLAILMVLGISLYIYYSNRGDTLEESEEELWIIENEEYYIEKQTRYHELEDEYEFKIKENMGKEVTNEQLKELEKIENELKELEPIFNEYNELKAQMALRKYNQGLETLEDKTVINKREDVTKDKECNGIKFTNISLRYNPDSQTSIISLTVTNISGEIKEEKMMIKIFGDVETEFPFDIPYIEPGQTYDLDVPVLLNISMAGQMEIVEYTE